MSRLRQRELAIRAAHESCASDVERFAQRDLCTGEAALINWDHYPIFYEAYIRLGHFDLQYTAIQLSALVSTTDRYIDVRLEKALEHAGVPLSIATFYADTDGTHGILVTGYIEPELLKPFGARLLTNDVIDEGSVCCAGQPLCAPFLGKSVLHEVERAIPSPASTVISPVPAPVAPRLPTIVPPIHPLPLAKEGYRQ